MTMTFEAWKAQVRPNVEAQQLEKRKHWLSIACGIVAKRFAADGYGEAQEIKIGDHAVSATISGRRQDGVVRRQTIDWRYARELAQEQRQKFPFG